MTRDELIASVYELCGYTRDVALGVRVNGTWLSLGEAGLDEFVSDIVPVLNERGWEVALPDQFAGKWRAVALKVPIEKPEDVHLVMHSDPVEAAFAVALEVLGD